MKPAMLIINRCVSGCNMSSENDKNKPVFVPFLSLRSAASGWVWCNNRKKKWNKSGIINKKKWNKSGIIIDSSFATGIELGL